MRHLLLGLLLLSCSSLHSQLEEPLRFPPSRLQSNGVRLVTATHFLLEVGVDGKVRADSMIGSEQLEFDSLGQMVRSEMESTGAFLPKSIEYRYDSLGRRTHLIEDLKDRQGNRITRTIRMWMYGAGMQPSQEFEYLANDTGKSILQDRIIFVYDESGRKTSLSHMKSIKEIGQQEFINYMPDGTEAHIWVSGDDTLAQRQWVHRDSVGRKTREENWNTDSNNRATEKVVTLYWYDDLGLLREKEIYKGRVATELLLKVNLVTYQYSVDGLLQEEIQWTFPAHAKDYEPTSVVKYEYSR